MDYSNFLKWLELAYRLDINKELRDTLMEHFGDNLNIYTDQDLYEQTRKIIQAYKYKYFKTNHKYDKYLQKIKHNKKQQTSK